MSARTCTTCTRPAALTHADRDYCTTHWWQAAGHTLPPNVRRAHGPRGGAR